MTYPEIFDRTCHATSMWLGDIEEDLGPDRQRSYHALKAVLHVLRDNLPLPESAHLAAQLPMLIRGMYFGEWSPSDKNSKTRSKKKFLEQVEEKLSVIGPMNPEEASRAVFRTLSYHLSPGEVRKARQSLAKPIRALWPEPAEDDRQDESQETSGESHAGPEDEQEQEDVDEDGNIHHLMPGGQKAETAANDADTAEARQEAPQKTEPENEKENDMRNNANNDYRYGGHDTDSDISRYGRGRGRDNYDDEGYRGHNRPYNERDDQDRNYGGRDYGRDFEGGGRGYRGGDGGRNEYRAQRGYSPGYTRPYSGGQGGDYYQRTQGAGNFEEEDRGSYGRSSGDDERYAQRGYGRRYESRYPYPNEDEQLRGWDENNRYTAGNRQSYGYEDDERDFDRYRDRDDDRDRAQGRNRRW